MKRYFVLFVISLIAIVASAGWKVDGKTKYYMTFNYDTNGYVCLGANHGQPTYDVYYATNVSRTDDAYWYISGDEETGYVIRNASTMECLQWTDDYDTHRYLALTRKDNGSTTRWKIENHDTYVAIFNMEKSNYIINLRVGNSHKWHVGCYDKPGYNNNEQINIYDQYGNRLEWEDDNDEGNQEPEDDSVVKTTTIVDGMFAENTVWYRMSVRGDKQLYTSGTSVLCNTTERRNDGSFYWCFTRNLEGYYEIYNLATGISQCMSVPDYYSGAYVTMDASNAICAFDLSTNASGGYNIQVPGTDACANDFESKGTLRLWTDYRSPSDGGSCIQFEEVGDVDLPTTGGDDDDEKEQETLVEHSEDYLYLLHSGNRLTVIPQDFLTEGYDFSEGRFHAVLTGGKEISFTDVQSVSADCPLELPAFASYKFNNKFNYQLFTDVIADDPTAEQINLEVVGIGKWLTPSFQLPEGDDNVFVWVGNQLQDSKHTRQRFDKPITYTIGRRQWRQLELSKKTDGTTSVVYMPFGRHTTVYVDWLTDRSYNTYTVPEMYINTLDGTSITSKDYYWDATIEIRGGGVFPDMPETQMQIKGRGNTSWASYGSKNPYRIKFPTKQKPLGMTKGKSWILLANKQSGSMTTNAIGHKVASLMGAEVPCHIVPVELYINGMYQGSYNFCEKIGLSNNSIDLDDDTNAAIVELDTYSDERIDRSNVYGICSKVNDPDVDEADYVGPLTFESVISDYNRMVSNVRYNRDGYLSYVDKSALVGYLATTELCAHSELQHPKSVFLYSVNVSDDLDPTGADPTPWKFGPLWDCDWAFGYEQAKSYFIAEAEDDFFKNMIGSGSPRTFWNDLRNAAYGSDVDKAYFKRWHKFIEEGGLDELLDFCDDYYEFAQQSLSHNNAGIYANDYNDYATVTQNSKNWLRTRAYHIYSCINAYELESKYQAGDVNGDGRISLADLAQLIDILLQRQFDIYGTADANADGTVDQQDIEYLLQNHLNTAK